MDNIEIIYDELKRNQIHNIPHKCKDIDCVETLAKANKMFYE